MYDPYSEGERFEYGLLMNGMQALFSCTAAALYQLWRRRNANKGRNVGILAALGLDVLTPLGCHRALVARGKASGNEPRGIARAVSPLLQRYLLISALQTTASFLSIVSLRHLSFPAITLAKSSKLVPVLLMNVLLYRRHFEAYKYLVVLLVTVGVWMFMALGKRSPRKHGAQGGSSAMGLGLLGTHLLMDGATNSTQDQIFATFGTELVTGTQMMLVMNAISVMYHGAALLLPEGLFTYVVANIRFHLGALLHPHWIAGLVMGGWTRPPKVELVPELVSGVQFLMRHPDAARDVVAYGFAGAAGQIAIFETLERFGSLTLVSITVRWRRVRTLLTLPGDPQAVHHAPVHPCVQAPHAPAAVGGRLCGVRGPVHRDATEAAPVGCGACCQEAVGWSSALFPMRKLASQRQFYLGVLTPGIAERSRRWPAGQSLRPGLSATERISHASLYTLPSSFFSRCRATQSMSYLTRFAKQQPLRQPHRAQRRFAPAWCLSQADQRAGLSKSAPAPAEVPGRR